MKRRSKKVGAEESNHKLDQQLRNLQQDWDSFNRSKPRSLRRCSTDSSTIVKSLQLLDNSPRNLMSSLQRRRSPPSEQWWRVGSNDAAREEILRERRAAIESGKLKGRRLFVASSSSERENEMGSGCSGDLVQESEVRSVSSYGSRDGSDNCGSKGGVVVRGGGGCCCCGCSCSGSSLSDEKVKREELGVGGEKVGINVEVERDEGGGGRLMVLMGWFSIGLMVFTLGIIYMWFNGGYGYEDEVMLVPT